MLVLLLLGPLLCVLLPGLLLLAALALCVVDHYCLTGAIRSARPTHPEDGPIMDKQELDQDIDDYRPGDALLASRSDYRPGDNFIRPLLVTFPSEKKGVLDLNVLNERLTCFHYRPFVFFFNTIGSVLKCNDFAYSRTC